MPTEHFNFLLPPNAWKKKPHKSTFQMTMAEAAERYPGAVPILSTKTVRNGTTDVVAAQDVMHGREHGPKR